MKHLPHLGRSPSLTVWIAAILIFSWPAATWGTSLRLLTDWQRTERSSSPTGPDHRTERLVLERVAVEVTTLSGRETRAWIRVIFAPDHGLFLTTYHAIHGRTRIDLDIANDDFPWWSSFFVIEDEMLLIGMNQHSGFVLRSASLAESITAARKQALQALDLLEYAVNHGTDARVITWPGTALPTRFFAEDVGAARRYLEAKPTHLQREAQGYEIMVTNNEGRHAVIRVDRAFQFRCAEEFARRGAPTTINGELRIAADSSRSFDGDLALPLGMLHAKAGKICGGCEVCDLCDSAWAALFETSGVECCDDAGNRHLGTFADVILSGVNHVSIEAWNARAFSDTERAQALVSDILRRPPKTAYSWLVWCDESSPPALHATIDEADGGKGQLYLWGDEAEGRLAYRNPVGSWWFSSWRAE